ncbi:dynactin subunit 5, putative [Plasmodium ovale]|uniref:Dynactin subunit 5 n=2 Tax=Plasmodium ovale TaxID=36330 RepID=A0A1A8VJK2_PLAOA|nr:dynactin subunit 5, putative [Plasmodium ovale curtisi]SBS81076.1 dynactin subunit 5, putative [Plasmodium ovale curtisi]SCA48487.1 dynactin subunit 5, putative [Plasmodium ovale]
MTGRRDGVVDLGNLISDSYLESYNTATFQKGEMFDQSGYVLTASGNKVCKDSVLCGMKHIHMLGRSIIKKEAILRGDLNSLYFGKYVIIGCRALVCPCFIRNRCKVEEDTDIHNRIDTKMVGTFEVNNNPYVTVTIGNNVFIGDDCIVKAAFIGNNVIIGKNCVIGERVVIKDNVIITDNSFISNDTILASFSKYTGCPAKFVKKLPESAEVFLKDVSYLHYKNFIPSAAA